MGQSLLLAAIAAFLAGCAGSFSGDAEDVQYAPVFCVKKSPAGVQELGRMSFASGVEGWATAFDPPRPTVAHWVGGRWTVMHLPKPPGNLSTVYDVSGLGDAWAVGATYPNGGSGHSRALVEHWAGERWRIVPTPRLHAEAVVLRAVIELSRADVWAVGGYGDRAGPAFPLRMLAEHWDGRRWRVVPMPTPVGSENGLVSIAGDAPGSLWTVASVDNGHGLVEHWDGHRWRVQPTPRVHIAAAFDAVLATGRTNAWIAGTLEPANGRHTTTLFEHWDGHAWTRVPAPATPDADPSLDSLAARGPQDIWAAGTIRSHFHPYTQGLVIHWDGSRWSLAKAPRFHIPPPVGSPDPEWASAGFDGIAIQPGGRPWAVGIRPTGTGVQERPLVTASCHTDPA